MIVADLVSDLGETEPTGDVSGLIGIGDSGGSNVARYKDEYIGDAVEAEHRSRREPR